MAKKKAPRRGKNTPAKATQSTSNRSGRATSSNATSKTNGQVTSPKANKAKSRTKTKASPKPSTKGNNKAQSTVPHKGANKTPRKTPSTNKTTTANKNTATKKAVDKKGRTVDGKVSRGRTLIIDDWFLPKNKHSIEQKSNRPVIVIESNEQNELALVQLLLETAKTVLDLKTINKAKQGLSIS